MFESMGQDGNNATQSTRGRKKKMAANSSASHNQGKMYRQQQQQQQQQQYQYGQGQNQSQFGPRGGVGGSNFANQMPPPSMRHSTGMGLGLPSEEDSTDFILDDLDRLTPRSLAVARYKRNHELLSLVFDNRRIDTLEPPVSPYADINEAGLREKLQSTQDEMEELRQSHAKRIKILKENFAKQDAYLHSVKRKGKGLIASLEEDVVEEMAIEGEGQVEPEKAWAREPSKGRIVGVGYVKVSTPEEVKTLLPKAPTPVTAAVIPAAEPAPATEIQSIAAPSLIGGETSAPLLAATGGSGQLQANSGLGEDTAMTSVSLEGPEADEEEEEEEDDEDGEEEEEEEEEGEDENEEGEEGEDGEVDQDGRGLGGVEDADADVDAEGDEDADGDADVDGEVDLEDADAEADDDAEIEEARRDEAGDIKKEPSLEALPAGEDTDMIDPGENAQLESIAVPSTEIDNLQEVVMEQEKVMNEEVNHQYGLEESQEAVPEALKGAPEEMKDSQLEEAGAPVEQEPTSDSTRKATKDDEELTLDLPEGTEV